MSPSGRSTGSETGQLLGVLEHAGLPARLDVDTIVVEASAAVVNRLAIEHGIVLVHLAEQRRSLEDAFFDLTGAHTGNGHELAEVG